MSSKTLRPFKCPMCPHSFKIKQFLQRHMAVHSDERNFLCEICGKTYKYSKGLNRHQHMVHRFPKKSVKKDKKAYKCDWKCFLADPQEYAPSSPNDSCSTAKVQFTAPNSM